MRTFVLLFVMFTSGCGIHFASDKWNHFAFSASMSSVATVSTGEPVESIALVVGLGLIKEIYDSWRGTGLNVLDLTADLVGATLGGYAATEIYREEFP